MMQQVIIPAVGESITSVTVAQWHADDGSVVERGALLATIETDKVSNELEADSGGTLKILVPEGEEVAIGTVVAEISGAEGTVPTEDLDPDRPADPEAGDRSRGEIRVPTAGESITSATIARWHQRGGETVQRGDLLVTLETDEVSNELEAEIEGVLSILAPEGAEVRIGALIARILAMDGIEAAGETPTLPGGPGREDSPGEIEGRTSHRHLGRIRQEIAAQLANSQQGAAVSTIFNEADMSEVIRLQRLVQEDFVAKHGVKLGILSFFVKAVVQGLKDVPVLNFRLDEDGAMESHCYDIGVAVETGRSVAVPVISDADRKSFAAIELAVLDGAMKAREGAVLQGAEESLGGFTISNDARSGSLLGTPVLHPPQSGTLGMHAIQDRPVAVDGRVEIRPMMNLALSYDRRFVDTGEAVIFLITIKEAIENPTRLMLEV